MDLTDAAGKNTMDYDELIEKLKLKAVKEGISSKYPPISDEEVSACEKKMGVKLPELVKRVYTQVANGGVGPRNHLLGLSGNNCLKGTHIGKDALDLYESFIVDEVTEDFDDLKEVKWEWPPGVVPICDWGRNDYTVLDCNSKDGAMIQCNLEDAMEARINLRKDFRTRRGAVFGFPGTPFEIWIASWLNGTEAEHLPSRFEQKAPPKPEKAPDQLKGESDWEYRQRTCQESDVRSQWEFARSYRTKGDRGKYMFWFQKAVDNGHPEALFQMAVDCREGERGHYDWNKGFIYASKIGKPEIFYADDTKFFGSLPHPPFLNAASLFWRQKVMEGDARAAFSLFNLYEFKNEKEKHRKEAAKWCQTSAEMGYVPAQERWGWMNLEGSNHVTKDEEVGLSWLTKAAEAGHLLAQYRLWNYFAANDRDWKKAMSYLEQGAANKTTDDEIRMYQIETLNTLADLNFKGEHTEMNVARAIKLLEQASKLSDASASYRLGTIYKEGKIVPQDWAIAAKWFKRGREQKDAASIYEYGLCLEQGLGVKQNMKQAITEFKQAMYKNYRPAESHLREIRERERAQTSQ